MGTGRGGEGGWVEGVGAGEEDAGVLVGMVAPGEEAKGAVGGGEAEAASGEDWKGEEAVAGVVVEGGDEGVTAEEEDAPEGEEGAQAGGEGAGEEGAVVGKDGVEPGVELEDGKDSGAADPIDLVAGAVELMGGGGGA